MAAYILKRLLLMVPTLFGVMLMTFVITQFVPGGPVEQMVSQLKHQGATPGEASSGTQGLYRGASGLDEERLKELRELYGFDKPAHERFIAMMGSYLRFDFGKSYYQHQSVMELVIAKLPVSISIGLWTFFITYLTCIPLCITKAIRDGSTFDITTSTLILIGYAIPGLPGGIARDTLRKFHDGLETERAGIIYGGEDLSVSYTKRFTWQITSIVDDKTNLKISWTATFDGNAINPCNTTATATAPVFAPDGPNTGGEGSLSMLRSYVQGDDYVLGKSTTAPGQALAVNLSTTNTVCAGNVATTTIPVDTGVAAGARGVVALQGKWQIPVPAGMSKEHWSEPVMFARVPTPVEEWIVGSSGIVPKASQRRQIAGSSTSAPGGCLKSAASSRKRVKSFTRRTGSERCWTASAGATRGRSPTNRCAPFTARSCRGRCRSKKRC